MDFFTLQKKLRELNLEIFTLNDLVKITGQKKEVIRTKLSLLVKQNKINRIKRGYYSLKEIENKFKLQKSFRNTYVAIQSVLEFYGSTTQRFNNLDLISENVLKNKQVGGVLVNFHRVKSELFFGYKKEVIDDTEIFVSNIEKTIIDCVYFSSKVYLMETLDFIRKYKEGIDLDLLESYLNKINSSVLNKRVGYLLSLVGIDLRNINMNSKYELLNVNKYKEGLKSKKWRLIINEDLI